MQYVLLADDDGALTRVLEGRFRAAGLRVVTAHDATHALFLMQSSPPSLAIMDIRMPAGNGLAVCEMMRGNSQLANVPVIIITGQDSESAKARARELSAEYICKGPGLWEDLRPLCERLLGKPLKSRETEPAGLARSTPA
jgi:DNA-binding response OmpR family regulator